MLKKIAAAAALALVASSSFAAAPVAFYGGVDVGATRVSDLDDTKASVGAFVGYGINPNFAVEVGYRQLGKFDYDSYFGEIDAKLKQTHVSVLGFLPLNPQTDVYARLGYNQVKVRETGYRYTYKEDADRVLFGLGLNYSFSNQLSGRVEVQKAASNITNLSAAAVWKF